MMLSTSRKLRGACNLSFMQCLVLLILLCGVQITIFEFYIAEPSSCASQTVNHALLQSIHITEQDTNPSRITQEQYNIVMHYLMDKNQRLASQIKDLIHTQKMSHFEQLNATQRMRYKPQSKPYKTMEDIRLLIPLPLIEDGLHEHTFNWQARKFSDYKMCHFLSSNHYRDIQHQIDTENINKINKFIRDHKHIPSKIQSIEQLVDIPTFTISTYNIWNINPFVEERMIEIAHILAEYHVDIVALQEVRFVKVINDIHYEEDKEEVNILQHELILKELEIGTHHNNKHQHGIGSYNGEKWNVAKAPLKLEDDIEEYLVIASRFEIEKSDIFELQTGTKKHKRILLYASIIIPTDEFLQHSIYIDVFHTHLGLNVPEHCSNVMEILNIMHRFHSKQPDRLQILLGDFNTYLDFEYPIDILTVDHRNSANELLKTLLFSKCGHINNTLHLNERAAFKDTWSEIYGDTVDVMRTFTNFADHRIEDFTATDRILYRNGNDTEDNMRWQVCDVWVAGDQLLNIDKTQTYPSDHRTVIAKMYYN